MELRCPNHRRKQNFEEASFADEKSLPTRVETLCVASLEMTVRAKRPMQQRLKQILRLPFRFPLLRAQTLELLDDAREFFLERAVYQ